MWETAKQILLSQHQWSAIFYLVAGAVAGSFISIRYSFKAQRPRLIVSGGGAGGSQNQHSWSITISNRPSFFGQNVDGAPARDVHAHLQPKERSSQSYMVFWDGQPNEPRANIEPGQQRSLRLFHWREGAGGYYIVDSTGEPVARFQSRELRFVLRLIDRLDRVTEFPLIVEFDDTHLKNTPRLQILPPLSLANRLNRAKGGIQRFLSAFRSR
jgi:hypothetical protein